MAPRAEGPRDVAEAADAKIVDPSSQEFFDALYARSPDPWGFAGAPYEVGRYEHVIDLLGKEMFARAFEPGCSIGELTWRIAARCRSLLATDISPLAVTRARARCAHLLHVEIRHGRLPVDLPTAPVDLVVLSEVGYYLSRPEFEAVLDDLASITIPGGLLVAAHWTGTSADHVLSGHEVHEVLDNHPGFALRSGEELPGYLIGSWRRR